MNEVCGARGDAESAVSALSKEAIPHFSHARRVTPAFIKEYNFVRASMRNVRVVNGGLLFNKDVKRAARRWNKSSGQTSKTGLYSTREVWLHHVWILEIKFIVRRVVCLLSLIIFSLVRFSHLSLDLSASSDMSEDSDSGWQRQGKPTLTGVATINMDWTCLEFREKYLNDLLVFNHQLHNNNCWKTITFGTGDLVLRWTGIPFRVYSCV